MYEIPKTAIEFESGVKVNQTDRGLRLVKVSGDSTPVAKVTVYANYALACNAYNGIVYEGKMS